MPKINSIEWKTNKEEFLKDNEISDLVSSMGEKGLNEMEENLSTPIANQMQAGLSPEALNIGGRAPLNELSQELLKKIEKSMAGMEALKIVARSEGNKHRQDEANEYYSKVIIEYRTRWETVKKAQEEYNNNRTYYIEEEVSDGNGGTKKEKKEKQYYICNIKYSDQEEVVLLGYENSDPEDVDPGVDFHDKIVADIKAEIEKVNEFYKDYVAPAIKLKEECAGLEILPSEIQQDATSEHFMKPNGSTYSRYTNPDGSIVHVEYDKDGNIKVKQITDSNGLPAEKIIYDEKGNIKEKYEYNNEDVGDGIYKTTGTKYTNDGNGTLNKDSEFNYVQYKWVDKNGTIRSYDTLEEAQEEKAQPTGTGNSSQNSNPSGSTQTNPGTGQASYTYDDMITEANAHKEIILPPGYELVYDGFSFYNQTDTPNATDGGGNLRLTSSENKQISLKYNKNTKMYEVYENNKKTPYEIKPDVLINGTNDDSSNLSNNTTLKYDSDGDGKADTIASKSANHQPTGTGNSSQNSNPSGSTYSYPGTGNSSQNSNPSGSTYSYPGTGNSSQNSNPSGSTYSYPGTGNSSQKSNQSSSTQPINGVDAVTEIQGTEEEVQGVIN